MRRKSNQDDEEASQGGEEEEDYAFEPSAYGGNPFEEGFLDD